MDRVESNRQNALRSKGPRTEEGRATVSKNALRHGGYAARVEAIPALGEEPGEFEALRAGLVESLHPIGALEYELVGKMASSWWRMLRAGRAEREGLEYVIRKQGSSATPILSAFCGQLALGDGHNTERLLRFEAQMEKAFFRILHELERLQARRHGQGVPVPLVVDVNVNTD
jgi:hypothetical protein